MLCFHRGDSIRLFGCHVPPFARIAADVVHQVRAYDLEQAGYDLTGTTREQWAGAYRAEQLQGTPGFRPNIELFRVAAEATDKWATQLRGASPAPAAQQTETAFAGKREAKRTTATPLKTATAFSSKPAAAPTKSRSQKVEDMRKARGQMVA